MPSSISAKPAAMYGIAHSGWGWTVAFRRSGVEFSKHFSAKLYQGAEAALVAAKAWRDEMLRAHPPVPRNVRAQTLRNTNTSGIPGISTRKGADGQVVAWRATTEIMPGQQVSRFFSIKRYGAKAKEMAIAERRMQLQQMVGLGRPHPAEAELREAPPRVLPAHTSGPLIRREIPLRTNTSGIPGVRRVPGPHPEHPGWWAAITTAADGKRLTKHFNIRICGEEDAKASAIAERQKQLELAAHLVPRKVTKRKGSS